MNLKEFSNNFSFTKKILYYLLFFSFIINLLMLAVPLYSLQVLDRVISSHSIETLVSLFLITLFIITLMSVIQALRSMVINNSVTWYDKNFTPMILEIKAKKTTIQSKIEIANIINDLQQVKQFFSSNAFTLLLDSPWSILYFIILFFIHPFVGLTAIISAVILVILAFINYKSNIDQGDEYNNEYKSSLNNIVQDISYNCHFKNNILIDFKHKNSNYLNNKFQYTLYNLIINNLSKYFRLVVQIFTTTLTAWLTINGHISVGSIIASSIIIGKALGPYENAINIIVPLNKSIKSLNKISEIINTNKGNLDLPDQNIKNLSGNLSAEKIFLFINKQAIISNLNMEFRPGTLTLITGQSGIGKSIFGKILSGTIKHNSGFIKYANINYDNFSYNDLSKIIGYVAEETLIYNGNIIDNITSFDPEPDMKKIFQLCDMLNISDYINSKPHKFNTMINSNSKEVPQSILKKIHIARNIYYGPKIFIIDQPFRFLDYISEYQIFQLIQFLKEKNVITIVIGYNINILRISDYILEINNNNYKLMSRDEFMKLNIRKQEDINDERLETA